MTDREHVVITNALELAKSPLQSAGVALGMWRGLGDWAALSPDSRADAGRRGLADLDATIAELAEVREKLAQALDAHEVGGTS